MAETRLRRDSCLRIPEHLLDALSLGPGSRVRVELEGDRLVVTKVAMADDPFAAAAKGPDVSAIEKIREQQKKQADAAKSRFDELMENPPEVKPEDNPDFWR